MDSSPRWWLRLGGPNAITLPAWLLTLPGGVVASLAFIPVGADVSAVTWILLGVSAHIVAGVVLLFGRLTYLRADPRPSRPTAAVATVLVAGMARGAFAWYAVDFLDLGGVGDLPVRAAGAALAMLLWFSLATLVVDGSRRHRQVKGQLINALNAESVLATRSAAVIRELREQQVARIGARIGEGLEDARIVSADRDAAVARVRLLVDDVVRPLSRQLEQQSVADERLADLADAAPSIGVPLRDYLLGMVSWRPFSPLVTALVVTVTPFFATITAFGPMRGGLILAITSAFVGGALLVARRAVGARLPTWPVTQRAAVVIAVWTVVALGLAAVLGALFTIGTFESSTWLLSTGVDPLGVTFLVVVALTGFTMVACAADGSVEEQRARTERELTSVLDEAQWAADRLRQQAWYEQRRLSRTLHGDVQARLVSLTLRLRSGVLSDSSEEASARIAEVSSEILGLLGDAPENSWRIRLDAVSSVWQDAIQLSVWISPDAEQTLDRDAVVSLAFTEVAGEAITNAVRHGDADDVHVEASMQEGDLVVRVVDDGGRPTMMAPGGSGSRLFDAVSRHWSLEFGTLTTLHVRIACGPEEDRS